MTSRAELLADFAQRYLWWTDDGGPTEKRIIAQVMNLGTYDDIRRLEQAFDAGTLRSVMLHAQAGWISDRSLDFWRGRLHLHGDPAVPEAPPRRLFGADAS